MAGFTVFLALLFFAVNLLVGLYATSVVTSVAYDGARSVAGSSVDHRDPGARVAAQRRAEASMRGVLGDLGDRVDFDWSGTDREQVRLRIRADHLDLVFGGFGGVGPDHVDRTVAVRIEQPR